MSVQKIGVAMLGYGVVGGGVGRILSERREMIAARTGLEFDVRHVVVRDAGRARENLPAGARLSSDLDTAIDDPSVQIVVELMGGLDTAGRALRRALNLGKPVVTANKSLLARHGAELFALARSKQTVIAFEASVGGGIPIINALLHGLSGNRMQALVGIINGTCNFILTRMTRQGAGYATALAEAQRQGFAEADPTLDVSGRDAAQKLALLASLAFNAQLTEEDVHVEGIDTLEAADIKLASELGYVIKLLAIGSGDDEGRVSLRVHPTLVPAHDVLAEVSDSFNAISVWGDALGHALFYGRGAGRMPTASAVVSDLIAVAGGTALSTFNHMRVFPDCTPKARLLPLASLRTRHYLRLTAKDQPGVLARVAGVLSELQISIASVLQREGDGDGLVPVVITTHSAEEGAMQRALERIAALDILGSPTVRIRILDTPRESA